MKAILVSTWSCKKALVTCLSNAGAKVQIISDGSAEDMIIAATGQPPNTDFDFFVIQVANAPFGLSWYQGDVQSDAMGMPSSTFRGRFNVETFIVAPGVAPAPLKFNDPPFPDAAQNPATGPVQTIWAFGFTLRQMPRTPVVQTR